MEIYVLDKNFETVAVIDDFTSLIWHKKYYTCGNFELCLNADKKYDWIKYGNMLARDDDESVMILEKCRIQTDIENGDTFIISGRSLESILSYRVIAWQTNINNLSPVTAIKSLIEANQGYRRLDGLVIDDSLEIPETMSTQYTGDNLMTVITDICKRFKFGFKMALSGGNIILSFYKGKKTDVIFSPEFDNLISSEYEFDYTNFANCAYIAGEGEGGYRKWSGINPTRATFLDLKEIFVDAKDISSKTNDGELSEAEYRKKLVERGYEKLSEHAVTESFESEIAHDTTFHYNQDYRLGDIVTVSNGYGIQSESRITEIIESWDENGYTLVPTFEEEQE